MSCLISTLDGIYVVSIARVRFLSRCPSSWLLWWAETATIMLIGEGEECSAG